MQGKIVLRSELEGHWYEADPTALGRELDGYLEEADPPDLEDIQALILPHAGYRFSGPTAAYGLRLIRGRRFSRVIVMGPSHRVAMPNFCSIPAVTHYATPFGEVPLDREWIDRIMPYPEFGTVPQAHRGENSVQIHIPFLHHVLGDFKLVPIVVGQLDDAAAGRIAARLRGAIDPDTLVIASTDFTHYGEGYGYVPFRDNIPQRIEKLDMDAFAFIRDRDAAGFFRFVDRTGATICGRHPVSILVHMLPASSDVHLLHYDQSGRMSGDYGMSCSYLSAAVTGTWPLEEATTGDGEVMAAPRISLSRDDRDALLQAARAVIEHRLRPADAGGEESGLNIRVTPGMHQIMGAFVTLHKDGRLRGCIGEIIPRRPLVEAVIEQAQNSAFNDPRFPPLTADELDAIDIEISALMPPWPISSWKEFEVGRHGILLEKNGHSSVFLPQVAVEQDWDAEETLRQLSLKAGLPPDAWREGCTFRVFEAIVFGEKDSS